MFLLPNIAPAPWFPLDPSVTWEQPAVPSGSGGTTCLPPRPSRLLHSSCILLQDFRHSWVDKERVGNVVYADWSVSQDLPSPRCLPVSLRAVNSANELSSGG